MSRDQMLEELSWAAGFFDGDGCFSTTATWAGAFIGSTDLNLLLRFQRAVQCGSVSEKHIQPRPGCWSKAPQFTYRAYADVAQVIEKLWPMLGGLKRTQARKAWRHARADLNQLAEAAGVLSSRTKLAWAAGFFDAEGCFSYTKRTGMCVSIRNTDRGLLERFMDATGFGKIYGPYQSNIVDGFSRRPQFDYRVSGNERVQAIAAMLWFNLGDAKKVQARSVLARASRNCHRGHPKKPGHTGCAQCTRAYWRSRRERPNTTAESNVEYLIA